MLEGFNKCPFTNYHLFYHVFMKIIATYILFFLASFVGINKLLAQNNLDKLLSKIEEGKTYALYKADKNSQNTYTEKETFYLKIVAPQYKTILDTIQITPALNGNLDTSNYFLQTEIIELKGTHVAWRTASISSLCKENKMIPIAALCLLKTTPKYKIIHRKFFPYKNVLDTTTTDYIIPAEYITIQREILVNDTKIMRISADKKEQHINPNDKIIKVTAGKWEEWTEVICPFGVFNDPKISDVQAALKAKKYLRKITGNFDKETKEALHQFQTDHKLKLDGLTPTTLFHLGVKTEPLIRINY